MWSCRCGHTFCQPGTISFRGTLKLAQGFCTVGPPERSTNPTGGVQVRASPVPLTQAPAITHLCCLPCQGMLTPVELQSNVLLHRGCSAAGDVTQSRNVMTACTNIAHCRSSHHLCLCRLHRGLHSGDSAQRQRLQRGAGPQPVCYGLCGRHHCGVCAISLSSNSLPDSALTGPILSHVALQPSSPKHSRLQVAWLPNAVTASICTGHLWHLMS